MVTNKIKFGILQQICKIIVRMQNISDQHVTEYKIKHCIDLNDFIELYNKSVGLICREYIGKHLVIYDKKDEYTVINSLSEIKEPKRVTELYIDGMVITDKKIFYPFEKLERIHGIPVLKITCINNMFTECGSLKRIGDLGGWDISQIRDMGWMFSCCKYLTDVGDLGGWDTSNVTNIHCMFNGCEALKDIGNLGGWDVSRVTYMSFIFNGCRSLTDIGDLGEWDTSNVTSMRSMFLECKSLTDIGDLGDWDTGNVKDMYGMFNGCKSLNHNGEFVTSLSAYQYE